jgi:hypothetical protein
VRQQLKALLEAVAAQQAESSTSRQRSERGRAGAPFAHDPNPPPSQQQGRGEGVRVAASAVRSRLGPNRDARNTIEARRRAESVDNNRDNRSRHYVDHGRRRHRDSDHDREHSWSPNQRGPQAFGWSVHDAKFPSRFPAPTNVPRYDGDTNPSVWLVDYQLACHAGGATDDLFVIKNLPLYLGDSVHTRLEHLPRTRLTTGPTCVGFSSATSRAHTCAPASNGSYVIASSSRGRVFASTYDASPSDALSSLARPTMTPSRCFRTGRCIPPSSTDSGIACRVRPVNSSTSRATTLMARRRWSQC